YGFLSAIFARSSPPLLGRPAPGRYVALFLSAGRRAMTASPDERPGADDVRLVPERCAVLVGGREVAVTKTQFRLLGGLLAGPGRAFSGAELLEKGIGDLVTERTVDVHVKELRRKLGQDGRLIETVRGQGYRSRPRPGDTPLPTAAGGVG